MTSIPIRMRAFVAAVIVTAAVVAALVGEHHPIEQWPGVVLLCVLAVAAGNMTFELPMAVSVSLGFAVTFAGIVYGGPLGGALVGAAGAVSLQEIRGRKPAFLMVGNGAQLALAAALAGVIHQQVILLQAPLMGPLVAPLFAATTFFVVNVALVVAGVALKTSMRAGDTIRALRLTQYWVSLAVLALLGLVLAELVTLQSWLTLLLLVLPFMAARRTFRVYAELSEAYTSTVRSLVTAIEAKDPYTKGHSERVAIYATGLAEALGLSRIQVDLLERAALLHDVGKIGIPLDTLTSPAHLSSEEVRLIRQHPDVGSRLVSDVEFLSDIVPVIRHHHERVDGAGYPDGLIGEDIPLLSRILAVADAYDAMTSTRAYRLAMSREAATDELTRVSGRQLDKKMTEEFIGLLDRRSFEVAEGA